MTTVAVLKAESAYTPGETVGVIIDNLRVLRQANGAILVKSPDGWCFNIPVDRGPDIQIIRRVPVEGQPLPGDVWADSKGEVYFAYQQRESQLRLENQHGHNHDWEALHRGSTGPLTLVYRPGCLPAGA